MRIDKSEIRDELAIALEELLTTPPYVNGMKPLATSSGNLYHSFLRDYINYAADKIVVYLSENELTERV